MKTILHYLKVFLLLTLGYSFIPALAQEDTTNQLEQMYQMSIEDMLNLEVVTATRTNQKISEVPAVIRVVTAQQITERGYFTLEDALADLPGFQFRNIQGFNSYSFLRGIPNQNNLILVMIDGVQVNELNSGGFYGGAQYNLSNIERIEVVYGPASALYGTNAMSGVINLITKKTDKELSIHALGGIGSFATSVGEISIGHYNKEKEFGVQASAMYKSSEKANLKGMNGDNNWTENMENFENDMAFDATVWFKKFSAGINYMNKSASRTTNYKTIGDKYLDRNSVWDINFINSYLNFKVLDKEKITYTAKVYNRVATVCKNTVGWVEKAIDTTTGFQVGYYRPNQLLGLENIAVYSPVEKLLITGGIIGEMEWLSSGFTKSYSSSQDLRPDAPDKPDILENTLLSFVLQGQYNLFTYFNFTAGIRYDMSSYYGNVMTPRLALVFVKDKLGIKLLYNNAFRAPRPWDYTSGIGNINLKPEELHALELNVAYNLNKYFDVEISAYRNIISQKFVKHYEPNDDWFWDNKDKVTVDGFDFVARVSKGKLAGYLNYSYMYSVDQDGVFVPEIAMHSGNAGITYSFNSYFTTNLSANYLGERKNPKFITTTGDNIIEDALIWNANIRYQSRQGYGFSLKVNNLTDKEYYHPSNRPPDRYRQAQRSILLSMFYNL